MNEEQTPQGTGPQEEGPATPPEAPPPAAEAGGQVSPNRNLMIVLSYLWILFLVPFLVEKDDTEVQWHAKHGLVLTVLEFLIQVVLSITGIGCFFAPFAFLAFAVIRLVAIVKGVNGERFIVPGVSQYADKF